REGAEYVRTQEGRRAAEHLRAFPTRRSSDLEMAEHLDHVILFSGDGDFRRLVEAVQRRGLRVSVASTIKSSPPMVADELRRQAEDRKSTRLNSSHVKISYAVFCLKKKIDTDR